MDLINTTLADLKQKLDDKEISSREICQAYIDRVKKYDNTIGAFLSLDEEAILKAADQADENRKSGGQGRLLEGLPVAIKDNINVSGEPTTCASQILEGYISPYNATAIENLRGNGAICFGKTNLDEFAMGGSTENSALKKTANPFDTQRVPGGSSGGSAAAVAASLAPASLGSDTGGSIRQPAAFCGVYGLKPTYGRVSRYGLTAFGSSLDQIGPLAKTPRDLALLLEATGGHDPKDATSQPAGRERFQNKIGEVADRKLRVGVVRWEEGLDEATITNFEKFVSALQKDLGYEVSEVKLPHARYGIPVYYLLATSEASTNLARFDGIRYGRRASGERDLIHLFEKSRSEGFGPEVKRRILLGTFALSSGYYDAYYKKASQVRTLIRRDFEEAFSGVDLLCMPTTPEAAYKFGENIDDPIKMYTGDLLTVGANLAGVPAVSVPYGLDKDKNMPLGIQLLASHFEENTLLGAAQAVHDKLDREVREYPQQW